MLVQVADLRRAGAAESGQQERDTWKYFQESTIRRVLFRIRGASMWSQARKVMMLSKGRAAPPIWAAVRAAAYRNRLSVVLDVVRSAEQRRRTRAMLGGRLGDDDGRWRGRFECDAECRSNDDSRRGRRRKQPEARDQT